MTRAETSAGGRSGGRLSLAFAVLLAADLLLIAASVEAERRGWSDGRHRQWLLGAEGGWPEQFGYAKEAGCAALLLLLWRRTRSGVFAAWAAVFACALVDDRLRVHEQVGGWVARQLALPDVGGLQGQDLGELVVWGLVGVLPLVAVVVLHRRSPQPVRAVSRGMAVVVAGYAFFGVVVDQLHALAGSGPLGRALGVLEDGGELVLLSVAVCYVGALVAAVHRTPTPPDRDPARTSAAASLSKG
ncbi:hypothetical protein DQ239_10000 [Blastococcus sp. TF02-09]|uniref:hypothetical protein n=1 Tax=Blastococcus sp. TF02-09 TaxID=2250576 RepID=UPI000DE9EED5|nr:hypothetical protein [Blastococcus sp. TF02-9]RBY78021.1 hypothetical protein DQ239_10000 [Blastococcus sp. TF02-9]